MSIPTSAKSLITHGNVIVISKHFCGPCDRAKAMLKQMNVQFKQYYVDELEWPDELLEEFHELAKMRTYPKIFIGEQCIGGASDLQNKVKDHTLFPLFDSNNITYQRMAFF